jgi:heme exporter protein A
MLGCPADRSRLEGLLERVGLAGEGDERARFMSSGMQRRLAIARLLLRTPRLLLLDEPFNSLDAEGVRLIVAIAAELRAAGGTVILVAHDLERGRGLEDRVLRMREGVLVEGIEGGTAPTVPARPELVVARGGVA